MDHNFQPSLENLIRLAVKRKTLLAFQFDRYQQSHQLTDDVMAEHLQITVEQLYHLKLCKIPLSEDDVNLVATHIGIDQSVLTDLLRGFARLDAPPT